MSKLDVSKITKGEARVGGIEKYHLKSYVPLQVPMFKSSPDGVQWDIAWFSNKEDAELGAEAFNVTNETGMGPRELKDKLDEAVRLLKDARDKVWNARLDEARRWGSELEKAKDHANMHTREFDKFLSTLTK